MALLNFACLCYQSSTESREQHVSLLATLPPLELPCTCDQHLLQLLLWPELVGVAALLLAAVGGSRWETGLFNLKLAPGIPNAML